MDEHYIVGIWFLAKAFILNTLIVFVFFDLKNNLASFNTEFDHGMNISKVPKFLHKYCRTGSKVFYSLFLRYRNDIALGK